MKRLLAFLICAVAAAALALSPLRNPGFNGGIAAAAGGGGGGGGCTTNLLVIQGIGKTNTTTGATSYALTGNSGAFTNSVLPGALVLVAVVNSKASAPDTPTLAGYGMAWTQIVTTNFNILASPTERLTVFAGMTNAEPTTDDLTATFGATQTGCSIRALQVLGTVTNGFTTNGLVQLVTAGANTTANSTITLSALHSSGSNAVVAFFGNSLNPYTGTNEVGWIEDTDLGYATPSTGIYCTYRVSTTDNTVTVTNLSSSYAGVAFEIKADCWAAPAGGSCATVRHISTPLANSSSDNISEKWFGGSFTPAYSYTICSAAAYLKKTGAPTATLSMGIYTDNANKPGTQIGSDSATSLATALTTSMAWTAFTSMSSAVTAGTKYWVVFKCTTLGDASNKVDYQFGDLANSTIQLSHDDGAIWGSGGSSQNYWFKLKSD